MFYKYFILAFCAIILNPTDLYASEDSDPFDFTDDFSVEVDDEETDEDSKIEEELLNKLEFIIELLPPLQLERINKDIKINFNFFIIYYPPIMFKISLNFSIL